MIPAGARARLYAPGIAVAAAVPALVAIARSRAPEGRRQVALVCLGGLAAAALVRWQLARLFVEEPPFVLERRTDGLEIRRYPPRIEAETIVERRPWSGAIGVGFRRVARYIFGGNERRERISMTAPVIAAIDEDAGARRVAFVMPPGRALASLPAPRGGEVRLREVPQRRVAVLRFRGRYHELPARRRDELLARVRGAGLEPLGPVSFAGYDPPSTLPWLRRNEVWVEVR